jgi:putative tryptophan/tyrosine transport system substrate-binding protein
MRRRGFLTLLGGAAASSVSWPRATRAQQSAVPLVGFVNSGALAGYRNLLIAFRKGLVETGFVEGQNLAIEYRWAEGRFELLPELAADLVQRGAAVIVTGGIGSALGVRKASATIPLVFLAGDDPVKYGLVASLNRPGGMATGVAWLTSEIFAKRLDLVRALLPQARAIGVLVNPKSPEVAPQLGEIEAAARTLGRPLRIGEASSDAEFGPAFASLVASGVDALVVSNDAFFNGRRERIIALAEQHRLPTLYDRREYTVAGGLMSYGTSYAAAYREIGLYAGRILKGTQPADLPIEQATRFELVINLKTASALGLSIPDRLLALADEVIE